MAGWLRIGLVSAALGLTGGLAGGAWAQDNPAPQPQQSPLAALVDGTDPSHAVRLLQQEGYRAKLVANPDSGPSIESGASGSSFWLHFEACDSAGANCEVIIFSAGFDMDTPTDPKLIEEWNISRFTKAFLDEDGDPYIDFVVNVRYGVTEENFVDTLNWFVAEFADFMDVIGWHGKNDTAPQLPGARERLNGPI